MIVAQRDWTALDPREEDAVVALLRDASGSTPPMTAAEIARLLDTTASHRLRNAAALALADLRSGEAGERIGEVLKRPEVAPQSGTLLFALAELGGDLPLDSLVNVVRTGSFEGRSEALCFADEGRISQADPDARDRAIAALSGIADGDDPEAAVAAQEVLTILLPQPDRPATGFRR